jgi:hypothetical protein
MLVLLLIYADDPIGAHDCTTATGNTLIHVDATNGMIVFFVDHVNVNFQNLCRAGGYTEFAALAFVNFKF